MASYPPPPGGGPGQGPFDPRSSFRYAKQQARLQKAAWRMERAAAKMQNRAFREQIRMQNQTLRRSSILGPLLMVGAGVALLLVETGSLSTGALADWFSRWWPLVLVGAGIVLLLEWTFDRQMGGPEAVYGRRSAGGGVVTLLILLAVFGGFTRGLIDGFKGNPHAQFNFGPSFNSDNLEQFFGDKQESTSEQDFAFPAETHLSVMNPRGDVSIVGHSTDGRLHLTVNKAVYGWSKEEGDRKAADLKPTIVQSGGMLSIDMASIQGGTTDLTITLPETGAATITANHGDINVTGMKAPVVVTALHGTVDLNDIRGTVTARTSSSGESFTAHAITGDVALKGKADDVNISDVTGQVSVEGDFYGDTHFEHLGGPVSFNTNRTHFTTSKVDGQVDISPGASMTADHLAGPTTLKTRSRNINFTDLAGDISVINSDGSVELSSVSPMGNITVENRSGSVTVNLPAKPNVTLQAEARDGKIINNLELTPVKSGSTSRLTGKLGDGKAQMDVRTTSFNIEIHAGPGTATKSDDSDDKDDNDRT